MLAMTDVNITIFIKEYCFWCRTNHIFFMIIWIVLTNDIFYRLDLTDFKVKYLNFFEMNFHDENRQIF
jgi:hypothetical protein